MFSLLRIVDMNSILPNCFQQFIDNNNVMTAFCGIRKYFFIA
jgi:hypothetical protein